MKREKTLKFLKGATNFGFVFQYFLSEYFLFIKVYDVNVGITVGFEAKKECCCKLNFELNYFNFILSIGFNTFIFDD